ALPIPAAWSSWTSRCPRRTRRPAASPPPPVRRRCPVGTSGRTPARPGTAAEWTARCPEEGSMESVSLIDLLPARSEPDTVFEAFASWAEERGLTLYPHQEEALIEVVSGDRKSVV